MRECVGFCSCVFGLCVVTCVCVQEREKESLYMLGGVCACSRVKEGIVVCV